MNPPLFMKPHKPLGGRAYGSIAHLPGSKILRGDKGLHPGQARILTEKPRKGDFIFAQEKLDGTNVAVANVGGQIMPVTRAGYRTEHARYRQHKLFGVWVYARQAMFLDLLRPGERLCGEWLAQAHGIRYDLEALGAPFVPFDLFGEDGKRLRFEDMSYRLRQYAPESVRPMPIAQHTLRPMPLADALHLTHRLKTGHREEPAEGVVYRCENDRRGVEFLAKWVRLNFEPGRYLPGLNGNPDGMPEVWNVGFDPANPDAELSAPASPVSETPDAR